MKTGRYRKRKTPGFGTKKPRIVYLDHDDPDYELNLELTYLMSLTTQQQYKMMFDQSRKMMNRLIEIGYVNPNEIVIRPANSALARNKASKRK